MSGGLTAARVAALSPHEWRPDRRVSCLFWGMHRGMRRGLQAPRDLQVLAQLQLQEIAPLRFRVDLWTVEAAGAS